ncbi:histidine kinase [Pseudomonas fluorescens ABAC62]|nr:histidine kinase [Pseudomonas fluorescens ABAC62]
MHASLKTFIARFASRSNARRLILTLCLGASLLSLWAYLHHAPLPLLVLLFNLATLVVIGLHQWCSRKSIKLQPQELARRLLQVQENERHRLSRELHDDIGQLLTAAKLQSEWLRRRLPAELQSQCNVLDNTLNETLAKVRDVSAILNPRQLASLGLEASVRAHLLKALVNTPVHWSLECQQRLTGIPEEMAVAAFRIIQEAVTNMLRHAHAHNLLVRLQRLPEGLSLTIIDDGQGFSPAIDPRLEGQRGMAGMSERVEQLGGALSVNSQPGNGTRIDALFPWAPRTLERASAPKVIK